MKLHGIELTNFRRHVHTRIAFKPGLTAIIGPNGAGKSTILEAVMWVLYGSDALRGVNAELRWEGAAEKAPVRGSLWLTINRVYYRIDRTLSGATLTEVDADTELAKSTTGVNSAVRELLGVDHRDFWNIFMTGQQDLKFLGVMKGADRSRYLNRIIGYHRVELAQNRARKEKAKYEAELKGLRSAADVSIDAAAAAVAEAQLRVQQLRQEGKEAWAAAGEAQAAYRQFAEDELRAVSGRGVRLQNLRSRIEKLEQQLDECEGLIEKNGQALQYRIEADAIVELNEGDIADEIERAAELVDEETRKLEEAESEWRAHQAQARSDVDTHLMRMRELVEKIEALNGADGHECPMCEQPLPHATAASIAARTQEEHERAMLAWTEATSRVQALEAVPPHILPLREAVKKARQQLGRAEGRLESAQEENEELRARQRELMQLANDYDADEQERAVTDAESISEQVAATKAELEAELAAMANDQPVLERAKELEKERMRCDSEVHRLKGAYEKAKAELDAAVATHTAAEERASKLAAAELLVTIHRELDVALGNLRTDLNVKLRPELCSIASAHVARMMPGMYDGLDLDTDYNPTAILPNGAPRRVISGGEGDIANLALRLAASEVVAERSGRPIEMLALDEIFGQLDRERKQLALEALRALRDRFPQVILITHHEEILEACDHIVRVDLGEHLQSVVRDNP